MGKKFIYLAPDWKVEKHDLAQVDLVHWFNEQNWDTAASQSQDSVSPLATPEITIPLTGWYTLTILVQRNAYHVTLASELIFGLVLRDIKAIITSASEVNDILRCAQIGDKNRLVAKLRTTSIKSGLSAQISIALAVFFLLMCCESAYQDYQESQTYQPISSVDQLQLLEVKLNYVDYEKGSRSKPTIFHLTTSEYPSVFYNPSGFPLSMWRPEAEVATFVNYHREVPTKIHIPKSYLDSLYVVDAFIPIYSLTMNSKEYFTPEFAIKVSVAYKEEFLPFSIWVSLLLGALVALIIRYRMTGNLLGSL